MGGGYKWAQQHKLLFTKADLASATAQDTSYKQQRMTASSQYGTPP